MSRTEARRDLLESAKGIAGSYNGNLTLRQLYYQLVAAGEIPNSQESYKRVGDIIAQARMAGTFPFDWLLDRTRESRRGSFGHKQADVDEALASTLNDVAKLPNTHLWMNRWYGQPVHVSVWVEKEALSGVFEEPCNQLGVSWFVLRGYSSLSSLYEWVTQVGEVAAIRAEAGEPIEKCVILYFGDHDPDGWEIPRSALRNVLDIAKVVGVELPDVTLERVALTRGQILANNPPPFPAKDTSSRFKHYVEEHSKAWGWRTPADAMAWELDALRPTMLESLITGGVARFWSDRIFTAHSKDVLRARDAFRKRFVHKDYLKQIEAAMNKASR